jgi:hypothetical protein
MSKHHGFTRTDVLMVTGDGTCIWSGTALA